MVTKVGESLLQQYASKKRMITAQIHHISRKKDLMHWCECMLCVEKQEHEK